MDSQLITNLKDSNYEFIRLVWDQIKNTVGGGELLPIETIQDNRIAKMLDMNCGIDFWQILNPSGIRGIASRVQWLDWYSSLNPYNTFTIRYKKANGWATEYEKLKRAFTTPGCFYPQYFCQAYVKLPRREGDLISCAVADTKMYYKPSTDTQTKRIHLRMVMRFSNGSTGIKSWKFLFIKTMQTYNIRQDSFRCHHGPSMGEAVGKNAAQSAGGRPAGLSISTLDSNTDVSRNE